MSYKTIKCAITASILFCSLTVTSGCQVQDVVALVKALDEIEEGGDTAKSTADPSDEVTAPGDESPEDIAAPDETIELAENQDELVPQLMSAVVNNDLASVQALIEAGVDLNQNADLEGESTTALNIAAQNGYMDIVEVLVANGADVLGVDENGNPPLMKACMFGHLDVVKFLIANEADPNQGNMANATPLWWAVFSEELEIVKFLVANGGDVNVRTKEGETLLQRAFAGGSSSALEIAQFLQENGATE